MNDRVVIIARPRQPGEVFVYLMWMSVVAILYFPCRWFAALKERRKDWWLSYL